MLTSFFRRSYQPLNVIEVSKKNLVHNYKYLSSINKKVKIAPVLKSNAYGHGLILVAEILEKLNPPLFCVDSLYEGYELINSGIKTPILIMGYVDPMSLNTKKLPFSFSVYSLEQVEALNKYQPQAPVHVFVDTGMHREGILINDLSEFIKYIQENTSLEIEGLMSHFGESEHPDNPLTRGQINKFKQAMKVIQPRWTHIANSGGVLSNYGLGNLGRCGKAVFGLSPIAHNSNLKPVLTLKTHISQVKDLKKGESVGYGFAFTAKKDMRTATLPIGYNDGVDRRLSNKGIVTIGNIECKIVGRISMNIMTIDITNVTNSKAGLEVVVFSNNPRAKNSIEKSAEICNTIPYDLFVGLDSSTKRIVV